MPSGGEARLQGVDQNLLSGPGLTFCERKFRHTYKTRIAVAALTLSLLCLVWVITGEPEVAPGSTFFLICLAAALFNVGLFVAIGGTVLTISQHGIRRESIFSTQEIRWEQITETWYRAKPVRPRVPKGLVGVLLAAARKPQRIRLRLTVLADDGGQINISTNYRFAREAIGIVLGQVLPLMVASVRERIYRGDTVLFGQLALSSTSVAWKTRAPIPIAAITRAEIVGRKLQLRCSGKWTSALKVRSDSIPNVLVFLEVLETIAPQLQPTRIDPLARVRL